MRGKPGRKHYVISAAVVTANYSEEVKHHCTDGCTWLSLFEKQLKKSICVVQIEIYFNGAAAEVLGVC